MTINTLSEEATITTNALPEVPCSRCHGTGIEPNREIPNDWMPVLDELTAAGQERASYSTARSLVGLQRLNEAWAKIREIWQRGEALGIPQTVGAHAVGVTRAQFHNIITGKVGGGANR
jgi:hypothetical protein